MATFNAVGVEEAIQQMNLEAERVHRLAPQAAQVGAEVAAKAIQRNAPRGETGKLSGSIVCKGPHTNVADGVYYDIHPDGIRDDGERNATVGYVHEFGRSNMPARPWMRTAVDASEGAITDAMADVLLGD